MAHVYFSKVLEVAPDRAWAIIRDFGSLPVWFPFVKASLLRVGGPHEAGSIRTNTIADGSIVEERLLEISDRDRRIAYDIVAADNIPTKDYSSTLRLHEVTADPDRCFAEWSADFDVAGDRETTLSWVRDDISRPAWRSSNACCGRMRRSSHTTMPPGQCARRSTSGTLRKDRFSI